MKKVVLVTHDPGGLDVVWPVFQSLSRNQIPSHMLCAGPSGRVKPEHAITNEEALGLIADELAQQNIQLLVCGTSWGTDIEIRIIEMCKVNKVPTIALIDYWSGYLSRFTDASGTVCIPDYVVVMDEIAKNEAITDQIPESRIRVLGHPGLDEFINKKNNVNLVHQNVLFISQPLSVLYGDQLGFTERDVILDLLEAVKYLELGQLHIKFHPKDSVDIMNQYNHLHVGGSLTELIPRYKMVVGMNSMGLLHSVLMGVKTISYQPRLRGKDLCITNKLGLTKPIYTFEELLLEMQDDVLNYENKQSTYSQYLWQDGKSTVRVTSFVMEVLTH